MRANIIVASTAQTVLFQVSIFLPSQTKPPAACIGIRLKMTVSTLIVYPTKNHVT